MFRGRVVGGLGDRFPILQQGPSPPMQQRMTGDAKPEPFSPHKVVVTQGAIVDVQLPRSSLVLSRIKLIGHATDPAALQLRYNGIANAQFPVPPAGQKIYDLSWRPGLRIPAGSIAILGGAGGLPRAELTFLPASKAPDISTWRGIAFSAAVAATGTPVTVNYDEIEGEGGVTPISAVAAQTAGVAGANAQWAFPAVGALQTQVESSIQNYLNEPDDAPPLPGAFSLTLVPTIVGAATTTRCFVYY